MLTEEKAIDYELNDDIASFLQSLKSSLKHPMEGCTEEEIIYIKQLAKGKCLPNSYIEFMKMAGNGIGFLRGSDYTFCNIGKLKIWAIELLEEDNSKETLTDNDFVFFMHQGYQFVFFKLDEGNNPPVYSYTEGDNSFTEYKSIYDFLFELFNGF